MLTINTLSEMLNHKEDSFSKNYKKQKGIYYTAIPLAYRIVSELLSNITFTKKIWEYTFLEPCGGSGNFIFSYLLYVYNNFTLSKKNWEQLLHNIYYCESNTSAKEDFIKNYILFAKKYLNIELNKSNLNIGAALIFDPHQENNDYIPITKYFKTSTFDIIITNPPYRSLRAERRHFSTNEEYIKTKKENDKLKELAKINYPNIPLNGSNLYKFFVEEILKKYSHSTSKISILIPAGVLKDRTCIPIRKSIIDMSSLIGLSYIPEDNPYIKAKQALVYLLLDNSTSKDTILQIKGVTEPQYIITKREEFNINNAGKEFLLLSPDERKQLKLLSLCPKISDINNIINMRGELDLTNDKHFITETKTPLKLIKGRNINAYKLSSVENGYIYEDFLTKSAKTIYIKKERIACQQIVNSKKNKRLMFTYVPPYNVLGNSCNFISLEKSSPYSIWFLLGLLNSSIMNWYFSVFNSNNHVSNYEIGYLPFPDNLNPKLITKIESLAKNNQLRPSKQTESLIDHYVKELYNIKDNNISPQKVVKTEKLQQLSLFDQEIDINKSINTQKLNLYKEKKLGLTLANEIYNNFNYKLSDLDLEIIKNIPPGGNWKNIPQSTIEKSKRLLGIQRTGGRTTLYGRLDYNRPSYTITTYFNRPGNGCYIHPEEDRVLNTREAARLQTFPDDYYFCGNQRDILNQIGNAVPPLMAYQLTKEIKKHISCETALDLFSGAGGLLLAVQEAGVHHTLATDINENACITLKLNNPELQVLCGDITNENIKNLIIKNSKNVDLICGGPPCQGFSLAGFRRDNDSRNELFKHFYHIVKEIAPKVFIFENVVGLLSHNNGQSYTEIQSIFLELGYNLHGDVLRFNEFLIPQKRNRVLIIGVRNDINCSPKSLFPKPLVKEEIYQTTVKDAIKDVFTVSNSYTSLFNQLMKRKISFEEFIQERVLKIPK